MFKAFRIGILLLVLLVVAVNAWLLKSRSTDWNNSLWVKIYPINADGHDETARYIESLSLRTFEEIETFMAEEVERHGRDTARPVRIELGREVREEPPDIPHDAGRFGIALWSLKMRWWVSSATSDQDDIEPDVRIFVRYHRSEGVVRLENSVGLQKGMFGIVQAYTGRRFTGRNNVIIAHEFLHTLGASDKYDLATGQPLESNGLAEPDRQPLYPQRYAEIMGGRIALSARDAEIPRNLSLAIIGPETAAEIGLID